MTDPVYERLQGPVPVLSDPHWQAGNNRNEYARYLDPELQRYFTDLCLLSSFATIDEVTGESVDHDNAVIVIQAGLPSPDHLADLVRENGLIAA